MVPFTPATDTYPPALTSSPLDRNSSSLSLSGELRESARRIRELERVRVQLAGTLLDVQEACVTSRDPDHAQRLISAAVRDLEDLDARLFDARTFHATMETCEGRLAS